MFDLAPGVTAQRLINMRKCTRAVHSEKVLETLLAADTPLQLLLRSEQDFEVRSEKITFNSVDLLERPELQQLSVHSFPMVPAALYVLHDVLVHTGTWIVMQQDGSVFQETIPGWQRHRVPEVLAQRYHADRSAKGVTEYIEQPVCLFQNMTFWNYAHWHYDCLSAITMIEAEAPRQFSYLLGPHMRHMSFFAKALPFFEGSVRGFHDVDGVVRCKTLIVSSRGFVATDPCRYLLGMFRHVASQSLQEPSSGRKIYVARFDAAQRRGIINEESLAKALEQRGFEIVVPGRLSYADQIRIFSQASCIIGPHGAGLTNIGFAPMSAKLVEIHPADYGVTTFLRLGLAKGMNVFCYLAEPETGSKHESLTRLDIDGFLCKLDTWQIG